MKKNAKILFVTLITILCFASNSLVFAAGSTSAGSNVNTQNSYSSEANTPDTQNTGEKIANPDGNGNNTTDAVEEKNGEALEVQNGNDLEEKTSGAPEVVNGNTTEEQSSNTLEVQNRNAQEEQNGNALEIQNRNTQEEQNGNALKEQTRVLEQNQDMLKEKVGTLEKEKNALENQLKENERTGNQGQNSELQLQIQQKEQEINAAKDEMKQIKQQIREEIRNSYTAEETNKLNALEKELKKNYKDIKVLPVDSIIIKGNSVKFDTPPVIKDGRTLIPARALSEAFGATVEWNQTEQKITIEKDGVKISLVLGNNLAYVNGKEEKIDVPPEVINNRTVVPLRFIIEKLGLKVNWDNESETMEIEEDQAA